MEVVLRAQEEAGRSFGDSILRAIARVRWLTLAWAAVGVVVSYEWLERQAVAVGLLGLMASFSMLATWLVRTRPQALFHPALMITELAVAAVVLLGDDYVFGIHDGVERAQSLPWAWPIAGIVTVGVSIGARAATFAAVALGFASYFGDARTSEAAWGVAASSKTALYVLGAVIAGYVAKRLRQAEMEIQAARASTQMARTLHDGVLQTLAVVQRRSSDPELAELAEQQDRELRDFLFGSKEIAGEMGRSLPIALRDAGARAQKRFELRVDVVMADDIPDMDPRKVAAVSGAVGEALNNAGKHANASRVVVYAEPGDNGGVFCSVKDNGVGFDVDSVTMSQGLSDSILGRMKDVGGRTEIRSRPGRGTEVQLWT